MQSEKSLIWFSVFDFRRCWKEEEDDRNLRKVKNRKSSILTQISSETRTRQERAHAGCYQVVVAEQKWNNQRQKKRSHTTDNGGRKGGGFIGCNQRPLKNAPLVLGGVCRTLAFSSTVFLKGVVFNLTFPQTVEGRKQQSVVKKEEEEGLVEAGSGCHSAIGRFASLWWMKQQEDTHIMYA